MEHWLPLFYERMATLFDYLPETTPVTLDRQAEESRASRLETIHDFYDARKSVQSTEGLDVPPTSRLPPEMLYLSAEEWSRSLAARPVAQFQPYNAPTDTETAVLDGAARQATTSPPRARRRGGRALHLAQDRDPQERDRAPGGDRRLHRGLRQRLETVLGSTASRTWRPSSWPEAASCRRARWRW